jgi:FkbM family methyltransferase
VDDDGRIAAYLKRALKTGGSYFAVRCAKEIDILRRLNVGRYGIQGYLDCGANIGTNTVSARAFFDDSVPIIAFEPAPKAYAQLVHNSQGLPNVHCYKAGLGRCTEKKTLFVPRSDPTSETSSFLRFTTLHSKERSWEREFVEEEVDVYSLDDFLQKKGIELDNNLMTHIDVEGFEYNVLLGGRDTILRKTKLIILEVTYGLFRGESSFEEILDLLGSHFSFRGCIDALAVGGDGESLFQSALFIRKT